MHYAESLLDDSSDQQQEAVPASLPDIDDDGRRFAILKQRDQEIDADLADVGRGVAVLREIAVEMGGEIEVQGAIMDDIDKKVDKNMAKVESLNKRLKRTIEGVRSGNRFAVDFICCLVVLALAGVLFNSVLAFT